MKQGCECYHCHKVGAWQRCILCPSSAFFSSSLVKPESTWRCHEKFKSEAKGHSQIFWQIHVCSVQMKLFARFLFLGHLASLYRVPFKCVSSLHFTNFRHGHVERTWPTLTWRQVSTCFSVCKAMCTPVFSGATSWQHLSILHSLCQRRSAAPELFLQHLPTCCAGLTDHQCLQQQSTHLLITDVLQQQSTHVDHESTHLLITDVLKQQSTHLLITDVLKQ